MQLQINGQAYEVADEPDRVLLWVLRDELKLRGTRFSCGGGTCGSCMLLIDGQAKRACQMLISPLVGRQISTIEGLTHPSGAGPHPLQTAWDAAGMPPCVRCRPAVTMTAAGLLAKNPHPTPADVDRALSDHTCWCYRHGQLRSIILAAAAELNGDAPAQAAG
jgi:isoquinoline 1-oxidoreductase alpha subunit